MRLPVALLFSLSLLADPIDASRKVTWQGNVGNGNIAASAGKTISTTLTSSASAGDVESALQAAAANTVVVLAAGTYTWNGNIDWQGVNDGVVLRGAGMDQTVITWQSWTGPAGMLMRATSVGEGPLSVEADLTADCTKGGTTITIGGGVPSWVVAGKFIGIDQVDDTSFVEGDPPVGSNGEGGTSYRELMGNGERGLGQLVKVVSKTATVITVEKPLGYGFTVAQSAQIFQPAYNPSTASPLKDCGIESMTINPTFSSGSTKAVYMQVTDSCYLYDVEVDSPSDLPCYIDFSYAPEIRRNYYHDFQLVGSGQGYGIALYHLCSYALIEDNIIDDSHNALTVNYGGTHNVFAYNYVVSGNAASGQIAGMNTHGTHAYMTLFEGNYTEDKVLGDWTHGSSSHNTVFRNRVTGYNADQSSEDQRTPISIEFYNRYWNIVGNILGTNTIQNKYMTDSSSQSTGSQGSIFKVGGDVNINEDFTPNDANSYTSGSFILIHGNWDYVQDQQTWEGAITHDLPNSYLYSSKPSYFNSLSWPPYNPANPGAASGASIPAGYRFLNGEDPPAESGGVGVTFGSGAVVSGVTNIQ